MSNWKTYKLSEVLNLVGGGTPKTTVPEYWNGDIPWLSVVDFGNDIKRVYLTEKTITEKGLKESSTKILKKGQLIISARGTVGELAVLGRDMAFNQSCYGIYANDKTENNFLYYLLKDSIGKIKKNTHGAVFDTITKQTFDNIEVTIPENIEEQQEIASILSSLDDKIELNLQMNQTLEAMAQTIFKEWFINFNFPGFDGELVDGLPKGWEKEKLGKILNTVLGGTPSTTNKEFWENGTIPWINSGKVNEFRIIEPTALITELALKNSNTKLLPKGTTVLAITGATLGQVSRLEIDACTNQSVVGILENTSINSEYVYLWTISNINEIIKGATGGAQQHINKNDINNVDFIVPDQIVLDDFKEVITPLFHKININCFENRTLTQIRDNLLPKLMTGKIEIQA